MSTPKTLDLIFKTHTLEPTGRINKEQVVAEIRSLIQNAVPEKPPSRLSESQESHTTYNDGVRDTIDQLTANLREKGLL